MRFDLSDLWVGFWKVLRDRRTNPSRPDYITRAIVIAVPLLVSLIFAWTCSSINAPGSVLTGIAILAGGFLTSFTHLSTLRAKFADRQAEHATDEQSDRDLLDEVATLLLSAVLVAVATAVSLVVGMSLGSGTELTGPLAWVVAFLATLVVILFVLTIPRMYNAYLQSNKVRGELSGADRRQQQ